MATKAKKTHEVYDPLADAAKQEVTLADLMAQWPTLPEIVTGWAAGPTDKAVYQAMVEAREHGLTWTRIGDKLGMSRQHMHKWYWQRFRPKKAGPVVAAPPDGFNPAEDTPPLLADVAERRAKVPDNATVFRAILRARVQDDQTMQEIADALGRKREQVYRDYWSPWKDAADKFMAAAREVAA
jgi:hypothetical protein